LHKLITVPTRYFDASRNILAVGGGIEIPPVSIDAYGQVHVLVPRTVTMNPAADKTSGSSTSTAELGGTVLMAGLTVGVKF
jgi:hypothetical protein